MSRESEVRARDAHTGPFTIAPEEDLLYSLAADGSRRWIDPVLTKGRFWRVRLVLGYGLILLFVALPHIQIAGKPGIFLDLTQRQFTFVGITMLPTDTMILLAIGLTVAFMVVGLTAVFGRVWCGYGCPHPIYLEFVFRPIEYLLEGKPTSRRRRQANAKSFDRLGRKTVKYVLYVLIAGFLAVTFVSYWVGWDLLWERLLTEPLAHREMLIAIAGITVLMIVDFAYFRDQMCTVACPYGRLQNVLFDPDTVIVGYDTKRGEPRGKKKARATEEDRGDCIDCGRCVTTCPTGVDIRRGLQMECIGCAQCIEACDEVMDKIHRPRGLIRYTSLRELETGEKQFLRPRVFVYGAIGTILVAITLFLTFGRSDAEVEILRGAREPFRMLPNEIVANLLRVRLTNHLGESQSFTVELKEPTGANLVVSQSPFVVGPDEVATLDVVAKLPTAAFAHGQATGVFIIRSDKNVTLEEEFVLLGPYE